MSDPILRPSVLDDIPDIVCVARSSRRSTEHSSLRTCAVLLLRLKSRRKPDGVCGQFARYVLRTFIQGFPFKVLILPSWILDVKSLRAIKISPMGDCGASTVRPQIAPRLIFTVSTLYFSPLSWLEVQHGYNSSTVD